MAEEPHVRTYSPDQLVPVIHFASRGKRGTKSPCFADKGDQGVHDPLSGWTYNAALHRDVLRDLELLHPFRSPWWALVLTNNPLAEMGAWVRLLGFLPPGAPLESVPSEMVTYCPPASAIANGVRSRKRTRPVLEAASLRFDHKHWPPPSRWFPTLGTWSRLTLSMLAERKDEDRWAGLGKTFMDPEAEDRTDGLADEFVVLESDEASLEMVAEVRKVVSRLRELRQKLSSHGPQRDRYDAARLYMQGGMNMAVIAATLGLDLPTVRKYIHETEWKLGRAYCWPGVWPATVKGRKPRVQVEMKKMTVTPLQHTPVQSIG